MRCSNKSAVEGKAISTAESSLLTAPEAQLAALRNAREIAKYGGNVDAIDSTKRAVASFTDGKDTGKKRTTRMTKKRKGGRHPTAEEETNLACLLSTRKALEEKRDEVLGEQKL